jgi:hypothetical protein
MLKGRKGWESGGGEGEAKDFYILRKENETIQFRMVWTSVRWFFK